MSLPDRVLSPELAEAWIRDCLRAEPIAHLTVSGTCMEPALKPGGKATLRRLSGSPRVGDVLLLRTPGGLRLHRVVTLSALTFRTKGDRGAYLDPPASDEEVMAVWEGDESRVTRWVRVGLSLIRLLNRPLGLPAGAKTPADPAHPGSCGDCDK